MLSVNLSCVFMSRGFLTVRLKRCVARLAEVARRMVVWLLLVSCLLVSRGWVGRGGGVGHSCGAWAALRRAGQPFVLPKGRWAAPEKQRRRVVSDARWGGPVGGVRMGLGRVVTRPPRADGPAVQRRFSICELPGVCRIGRG